MKDQKFYFCYIMVRNWYEFGAAIVMILIGFLLLSKAVHQYRRARRVSSSHMLKRIYILIFIWGILYISKLIFSEVVFVIYSNSKSSKQQISEELQKISKAVLLLDISALFTLQTILILIPYYWMINVINIFKQFANLEDSPVEANQGLKFELYSSKLLKLYLVIRAIFLGFIIPFLILDVDKEVNALRIIVLIMLFLLLAEDFFVLVILGLGVHALKANRKLQELLDQNQLQTMLNQYAILITSTIVRFIVVTLFIIQTFFYQKSESCSLNTNNFFENIMSTILLISEAAFTHYLPVAVVLRMYNIKKEDTDLSESLLAVEQDPAKQPQFK